MAEIFMANRGYAMNATTWLRRPPEATPKWNRPDPRGRPLGFRLNLARTTWSHGQVRQAPRQARGPRAVALERPAETCVVVMAARRRPSPCTWPTGTRHDREANTGFEAWWPQSGSEGHLEAGQIQRQEFG